MRITYLSGAYLPSEGANAVHVMHQCAAWANLGHEVTLVARAGEEDVDLYDYYGVERNFEIEVSTRPQVRVLGAIWWAVKAAFQLRRKKVQPDLIYSREVWALALSVMRRRVPFIHEKHTPGTGAEIRTEKWLMSHPSCKGFVFNSHALMRTYSEGVPRAGTVPCYATHNAAQDCAEPSPPQRNGPLHIGYVGSFREGYGVDTIVAFANALPHIRFTVVGGMPNDIQKILDETNAASLTNLEFAGFVPPSQLNQYYKDFDVVIAPYDSRTAHIGWISPMKFFEYMAHGRCIVCSDFPVLREIITPGENGDILPAGDMAAWTARLEELDKNPDQCVSLGAQAFAAFKAHHTWERRGEGILNNLVPGLLGKSNT